jgi:hypothetical protein
MGLVSWLSGIFGDWNTASNWSTGNVPGSGDNAVIAAQGTYDVTLFGQGHAASLSVNAAGATLYDAGALTLAGTLALRSGTLALAYGAMDGGTLAMDGGSFVADGGVLNGVAVQGVLGLQQSQASLFVTGGLALTGNGGSGSGSIALTGAGATLDFIGSQSLNAATIDVGAANAEASLAVVQNNTQSSATTLTLGSGVWLRDLSGGSVLAIGPSSVGTLANLPTELLSQGTITVSGPGSDLQVTGVGTFANQGSIAVANGATLTLASGVFTDTGSLTVNSATLALGGTFAASELANLGSVTLTNGTVSITGTAENAGGTLVIGTGSTIAGQIGEIALAGTLLGGAVQDGGDGLSFAPGTGVLDGVTYEGVLDLSEGGVVTLEGGASVVGVGVPGPASILDTGAGSSLLLQGSETLNSAVVTLGNAGTAAVLGTSDAWLASSATTAVLGQNLTLQQAASLATIEANGSPYALGFSDTLIGEGLIAGAIAGGQLHISGYGTFINQGSISLSNGDTLTAAPSVFSNTGTISVGAGSTAILGGPAPFFGVSAPSWSNSGDIIVSGGTLVLAGNVETSQLGRVSVTGGTISLTGTLDNAGTTLTLGSASMPSLSLAGTIVGGTLDDPGADLSVGAAGIPVLDGVQYQGTLSLGGSSETLRVRDGLSLAGTATITGAGAALGFWGTQEFDNASVQIGASGTASAIDVEHDYGLTAGSTLTLGPSLTVTQVGLLAAIGLASDRPLDGIVNDGTIVAGVSGGDFTIGGTSFSNQGSIAVSNGDTLAITAGAFSNGGLISVAGASLSVGGSLTLGELGALTLTDAEVSVSGSLDLSGSTLAVGRGSAMGELSLAGTLQGGTISDSGNVSGSDPGSGAGGGLVASGAASLDGVTYEGPLDLSRPFAQLAIADGITLTDQTGSMPGTLLITGVAALLEATSSETIDNATIDLGSAAGMYLGQRIPPAELAAGPDVTLTLGANAILTEVGHVGALGDASLGHWEDSIVNDGQISSGMSGATLTLGSSFFTNAGSVAVSAGATVLAANVDFTNSGAISLAFGSSFLVSLYEYFAAPDAGPSVFTNAGTIDMHGALFQCVTDAGLFPWVPLVNQAGALIQGSGILAAPIANSGTVEATGGALSIYGSMTGTGTFLIDPGAILNPVGGAATDVTVQFNNQASATGGTLALETPSNFAGTIAGYLPGDTIDLPTLRLVSIGITNGTLVANTQTQTIRFLTASPVIGEVSVGYDRFGGNTISYQIQHYGSAVDTIQVSQSNMLFWASGPGDVFQGLTADLNGAHFSDWLSVDSLDFTNLSPANTSLTYATGPGDGILTVSNGTHSATITLFGTFAAAGFHALSDGNGGTMITYHNG